MEKFISVIIMKNFLSKKKKSLILSAITLGCSLFNFQAYAMENVVIENNGKKIFDVQYYGKDDKTDLLAKLFGGEEKTVLVLNHNLSPEIKAGLNNAFMWWAEIIGPGANMNQPVQYFVGTYDVQNADAESVSMLNGEILSSPNFLREIIQSGKTLKTFSNLTDDNEIAEILNGEVAFGFIRIGKNLGIDDKDGNFGWANYPYFAYPIAQAMRNIEITPVMFHEIGHSLGFLSMRDVNPFDMTIIDDDKTEHEIFIFNKDADDPKSFNAHLRNKFGKKVEAGMWILTPEIFESDEFKKLYKEKSDGKILNDNEVFLVDDTYMGEKVKRNGKVYLYFEGENVSDALDGKTFERADGTKISGIPINLWEEYQPEFSHSDLSRSMMSHHNYRSYNNFMEAELAVLQDLGYKIDRKNFYGKSVYRDNLTFVNDNIFSARENGKYIDGYNTSTLGVGLHVYGSNNNIIQRGNIFTKGYGAVGIRVDGLKNKITLDKNSEIHSDGDYGTGILIAYGKNHEVNVDGTVTAYGLHGDAVHFDFGANSMGANTEYRGSFIRYIRRLSEGQPAIVKNVGLNEIVIGDEDFSFTDFENGDFDDAMADTLNVSGKLFADSSKEGRAIYVEEEAFVKNININSGAEINGDIVSDWKKFNAEEYGIFDKETKIKYRVEVDDKDGKPIYDSKGNKKTRQKNSVAEPLMIQYKDGKYLYTEYIPELVTNLNFNSDLNFSQKISGNDNIKINVNGGTLNFNGGTADVVNVNVANGAKVIDGNFTVNDMSAKLSEVFDDDTTGKFFNHGTISAANKDFTINGDLISDGTLQIQNGKKFIVNGTADLTNTKIELLDAEKNLSTKILTADKIICENVKIPYNYKLEIVGNDLILTRS